ncbi:MAG: isochorismatase family protein [Formosimonas sp.]
MRSALIVIDVQNSFLHSGEFCTDGFADYQHQQTELIHAARAAGVPIVGILHESRSTPAFFQASGWVTPMDWLPAFDVCFTKHVHNAFTDTKLRPWLAERDIGRLIISGIRTEQCCETTARVAADLGYDVDFALDATMTFPMTHNGVTYSADEIKARTALVLDQRFARVVTVAQLLQEQFSH